MECTFKHLLKRNFALRIFFFFAAAWGLLALGFTAFLYETQRRSLYSALTNQGRVLAGVLASSSRLGVFSEDRDLLQGVVSGLFGQASVSGVALFNRMGMPLIAMERSGTGALKERKEVQVSFPQLERTEGLPENTPGPLRLESEEGWEFWHPVVSRSSGPGDTFFVEARRNMPGTELLGFAKVVLSRQSLQETLRTLLIQSIFVWAGFFVTGAAVTFFMARRMMGPLRRLTEGVQRLGRGEKSKPVEVDSEDELGRLAQSFNDMTKSLEARESEKRELENQLMQSQKMEAVGSLAGGISHDFNNVLAAIIGYCELALSELPPGSEAFTNIEEAVHAARRGGALVRQILLFGRKHPEDVRPVQLEELSEGCMKMIRATLPAGISIEFRVLSDMADVMADPTQIEQVLINLSTNAAHAMPDGGALRVTLETVEIDDPFAKRHPDLHSGTYVRLSVSDTGCGIDPAIQGRMFDPYFTTKEKGKGSGLGLAVVHGIIRRHSGAILVKSKPGEGSVFEIYLPAVQRQAKSRLEEEICPPQGRKERILVVDDEVIILDTTRKILTRLGYDVTTVEDPLEALDLFQADAGAFDLVLTDAVMPNLTGDVLASEMRRIRPDMAIILSTGYSERITPEKVAAMGGNIRLLLKPLTSRELAGAVRDALDKAASQKGREAREGPSADERREGTAPHYRKGDLP